MSDFGHTATNDVPDDPFDIPDNTYACIVSDAEMTVKKADVELPVEQQHKNLHLTYTITEGDFQGQKVQEYRACNADDSTVQKANLKQRLLQLGVPRDALGNTSAKELIGIKGFVTTKKNGDWTNVQSFSLDQGNPFDGGETVAAGTAKPSGGIDF